MAASRFHILELTGLLLKSHISYTSFLWLHRLITRIVNLWRGPGNPETSGQEDQESDWKDKRKKIKRR